METEAFYYDGESSARSKVSLILAGDNLHLRGADLDLYFPLAEIRISPPLASVRRSLYLPDGAVCEIAGGSFAASLEHRQGKGSFFSSLHRWEMNLKRAFAALAATISVLGLFIHFGLPMLAKRAAFAIPPATEASLGIDTLHILDRTLFEPTNLDENRQNELRALFATIGTGLDDSDRSFALMFRRSRHLGANALALPGGTVVLTDELEKLAEHDEEIIAVLAHEIGHVRNRHALRQVIQSSTTGLIVATLTGDVFSATSLAAALPTMLADASFSRDMEREADDFAAAYLQQQGISLDHFAAILLRLQQSRGGASEQEDQGAGITDYLSTHPATDERIERLRLDGY
jgi:Zn-dependent protease with chaperone function